MIWIVNGECQSCGALVREPGVACECLEEAE